MIVTGADTCTYIGHGHVVVYSLYHTIPSFTRKYWPALFAESLKRLGAVPAGQKCFVRCPFKVETLDELA